MLPVFKPGVDRHHVIQLQELNIGLTAAGGQSAAWCRPVKHEKPLLPAVHGAGDTPGARLLLTAEVDSLLDAASCEYHCVHSQVGAAFDR